MIALESMVTITIKELEEQIAVSFPFNGYTIDPPFKYPESAILLAIRMYKGSKTHLTVNTDFKYLPDSTRQNIKEMLSLYHQFCDGGLQTQQTSERFGNRVLRLLQENKPCYR